MGARLFPVLLHASFKRHPLEDDAPGVNGLRYRPSWPRWSRALQLPPPSRAQRGPCLVDAVLGVPDAEGLEIQVLVPGGLREEDLAQLQTRIDSARQILEEGGAPVRAQIFDSSRLEREPDAALRTVLFGALLAGRVPAPCWQALESAGHDGVAEGRLAVLVRRAPTEMARLALALMSAGAPVGPLEPLGRMLRRGERARLLADPSVLPVAWSGQVTGLREPLEQAFRIASGRPVARPAPLPATVGSLLELGRVLAAACARAAHGSRLHGPARQAWRDALGSGFPRLLLPALGRHLLDLAGGLGLSLVPQHVGEAFEVQLPNGTPFARGATPVQARVRAIALAAEAGGERLVGKADPAWGPVAARLAKPRSKPTLLLVVEPAGGAGPPFDPLNRGPRRELAFAGALAIQLRPGRHPSARVLSAEETVVVAMRSSLAGTELEVVPGRTQARPVAARLAQIAGLLRQIRRPELALQVGGAVYVPRGDRLQRYGLARFLTRPRRVVPDPDAPDLALSPGERKGLRWTTPGVVQCRVSMLDDSTVAVLYADGGGHELREVVALAALEEHLRDARTLLQAADPAAILALRLSDDVEPALRRAGPPGPRLEIGVSGDLPFGLILHVGPERFEARSPHGWSTAAQAVLSRWQPGAEGHVAAKAVTVRDGGERAKGLVALYARSLALRRLRVHLSRLLCPYRGAMASREEG